MEQDLISKKELLELTGISYGQLYRWKRKNLIPEEWFVRKATFTGQETFFPREKILARLDRIKGMKDDLSLDDIADLFSPLPADISLTRDELVERNIVSEALLTHYLGEPGKVQVFPFAEALRFYVAEKLLVAGEIGLEEGRLVLALLEEHYPKFEGRDCELVFLRKLGIPTCCLVSSPGQLYFEGGAKIVARLNLASCVAELKLKTN